MLIGDEDQGRAWNRPDNCIGERDRGSWVCTAIHRRYIVKRIASMQQMEHILASIYRVPTDLHRPISDNK
jgi:hypothetical protein